MISTLYYNRIILAFKKKWFLLNLIMLTSCSYLEIPSGGRIVPMQAPPLPLTPGAGRERQLLRGGDDSKFFVIIWKQAILVFIREWGR